MLVVALVLTDNLPRSLSSMTTFSKIKNMYKRNSSKIFLSQCRNLQHYGGICASIMKQENDDLNNSLSDFMIDHDANLLKGTRQKYLNDY